MVQIDKLSFYSKHSIDKIVHQGEVTVVNDGNTSSPLVAKIVETTRTNSYGRAGLIRARWSINGGSDWQSIDSQLTYTFHHAGFGITFPGLDSAISVGSSNNSIVFRTANGRHGNVSSGGNYTPVSRTFLIQYAMYERG